MTTQLSMLFAPLVLHERLQSAQNHRSGRVRTHAMPVGREIPRPVGPDALEALVE